MKISAPSLILLLSVALGSLSSTSTASSGSGFCHEELIKITMATKIPGGIHESENPSSNSIETEELGRFAVDEHNKKQNAILEFARVVEAKEQVVAGTLHHLVIEAVEAGKKKLYEAKIWVKPWLNFKELQEFKYSRDSSAFTSSDLGVKRSGGHLPGWKDVPSHDPSVQDAANHALETIQKRSNSLFPYELQEIADAKAEVVDESAKFQMVMKVKRGSTEENYKVEVHRNCDGGLHLNHMEPHAE